MAEAPPTRPSLLMRLHDAADGPAWTQFVEIYAPLIHGFGRKRGLQDADAADLTQEVLQAVARAIRGFDYDPRRGSFRGWLFTVVRNKLRTFWERQARQVPASGSTTMEEPLRAQPDPAAQEQAWWDDEYERRMLFWAAEQVRPTVAASTWQAFWATAVEGQRAADVARSLGLSVAAVYMARSRVQAKLKELIEESQGDHDHG